MSWLQVYTLRLRSYEHSVASGRVVFVVQLQLGQQDNSRATDLAKRSYSEFRTLWKDLQRATSGNLDDIDVDGESRRSTRLFARESWGSVSRLLAGSFRHTGHTNASRKRYCRCTQTSCPFQRLHHLLKDFPFPRKQLLQHKDANALHQRRTELENFLVQLQRFFCGYPRAFLETAASTQRCEVLRLISTFTGMDIRPASLSAVGEEFTTFQPERKRYFSYCVSPVGSPSLSPSRLTDTTDNTEETLMNEELVADNQFDDVSSPKREQLSHASIRSSAVFSSSSSLSLPPLHVKSANVKTFSSPLDDVKDNLLRQMGPEVEAAVEQKQLSAESQWEFALFQAAEQGLYAEVMTIIRRGTDVNSKVWSEATPLHAASGAGQVHVVQCLLSHGADADRAGPMGMTPLMYAVNNSQLETTKVLLRAGADVNLCNIRNVSPVHLAVVNCSLPMLLLLLDHGATVDIPNTVNGRTPLHIAAEAGDKGMCEILLKYGARVSQCNASGRDATEVAIVHGHWRVQELCSQYKRGTTTTLFEESDGEEEDEDFDADGERSRGRTFCGTLDYIDESGDDLLPDNDMDKEVDMIHDEGTLYAVL